MEIQKSEILNLWHSTKDIILTKRLAIICNTKCTETAVGTPGGFQMDTEYFSDDEFEQITVMFNGLGLYADYFTYEDQFFKYVLGKDPQDLLVYNAAQSGTGAGRKSLVPAFCNLHKIPYTGSNPYVVALCRHKYHVNRILANEGIPVPQTWAYLNGWIMGRIPSLGSKVLIKPIYESASIGIDRNSIKIYSAATDQEIALRSDIHNQPIIAQEFISGYEVEVPMIRVGDQVLCLPPVGITLDGRHYLGNEILDYERIYFDRYGFYIFSEQDKDLSDTLCDCASNVANILGMEGLCRVDFRIKRDGSFFVTDVSTNPHFVQHSSVHFAFNSLHMASADIARTILAAALMKR